MKLVYIAGKLNGDACTYIKNVHNMVQMGEYVRQLGCCVAIPCNDFIHGLVCGTHEYEDYFENNLEILKRCDAIMLVPGYETSKGVAKEVAVADELGIPVFSDMWDLMDFLGVA